MAGVESKSMDAPDEVRTPDKTRVDVVTVGGSEVGRLTFQPGWRWSECIKPVVGTDSCRARHVGRQGRRPLRPLSNRQPRKSLGPVTLPSHSDAVGGGAESCARGVARALAAVSDLRHCRHLTVSSVT